MTSDAPWNERPHSDLQVISGGKADDVVALRPPTGKEERFIQEVLGGSSLAEAYRRAYSAQNMSASNTRTEASRVAARPHVSQALHDGWAVLRERALHSDRSLRTRVAEGLLHEAENAESDSARVSAWVALGKTCGLFEEQVEDDPTSGMTPDDLLREIEHRLKKAFGEPQPAP